MTDCTGAGDLATDCTGAGDLATGTTGAGDLDAPGAGDLVWSRTDGATDDGAGALCDAPGAGDVEGATDARDLLDLVDNGPRLSGIIDVELVIELDS